MTSQEYQFDFAYIKSKHTCIISYQIISPNQKSNRNKDRDQIAGEFRYATVRGTNRRSFGGDC